MTKLLITGCAGFIGFHLVNRLLENGYEIVGVDNLNDYYDVKLKEMRLAQLGFLNKQLADGVNYKSEKFDNFRFIKQDLSDISFVENFMVAEKFDFVINLAAQAGVRYSIANPRSYTKSNIDGFLNILEGSKASGVKHLLFASSSSVYGLNSSPPFSELANTDYPISMYAATKKANELMAHTYSHLYNLPITGLRFFTVYGPWGRPDMAPYLFTKAVFEGKPIDVFGNGELVRDFTFISDITEAITRLLSKLIITPKKCESCNDNGYTTSAPFQIFNIGNSNPIKLNKFIEALESAIGRKAKKNYINIQNGDVVLTHSDVTKLYQYIGFKPCTDYHVGVKLFVDWYKNYML